MGTPSAAPAQGDSDQTLEFHPLANIFPLIEGAEFDDLVADVAAHSVHEPIWIYEGKILDGRNRYRAAQQAGVDCPMREYTGDDPVGFVISLNLKRRHLDESQRAMVAAKLATLRQGDNQHTEGLPIGRSSELLNVGERSVARAREVLDHGVPELQQAVDRGEVSVSAAADVATQPAGEQHAIVARGEREILKAASEIRGRKAEVRHAERIAKLVEVSGGNAPLTADRKFPILYADPPWKFSLYNPDWTDRAVENKYPLMPTEEICALDVQNLATHEAIIFMWSVTAMLPDALKVLAAWDFEYVHQIVWVKPHFGLGNWVRAQHELLLIGRRGSFPTPLPGNRPPSVIQAPVREHSRKPDEAYQLIERMYPDLPKIELFARNAREGWAAWGNQVPQANDVEADRQQCVALFEKVKAAEQERQEYLDDTTAAADEAPAGNDPGPLPAALVRTRGH